MPRSSPLFALLLCAAAGCAAEAPAPLVTNASAPPRHGPWQQFCEQAWNVPQASGLVSARGADGWELVAMYNGVLCYKRPAPEPTRAPVFGPPAFGAPAGGPTSPVPIMRDPGF